MITIDDLKKQLGTELTLVILVCRVYFESETSDSLKAFLKNEEISWDSFFRLCRKYRIRPVIYIKLKVLEIPDKYKQFMENELFQIGSRSWTQLRELERIILLLDRHKIKAIPYKGISFSKQFFNNIISRESSDLDIIIPPEKLIEAIEVLKKDGYLPLYETVSTSLGKRYTRKFKEFSLDKYQESNRLFLIELHWGILDAKIKNRGTENDLTKLSSEKKVLLNEEINCLTQLDHAFAIFCHHVLQDSCCSLKYYFDLTKMFIYFNQNNSHGQFMEKINGNSLHGSLCFVNDFSEYIFGIRLNGTNESTEKHDLNSYLQSFFGEKNLNSHYKYDLNLLKYQLKFYSLCRLKSYFFMGFFKTVIDPEFADISFFNLPQKAYHLYYPLKPFRILFQLMQKKLKTR